LTGSGEGKELGSMVAIGATAHERSPTMPKVPAGTITQKKGRTPLRSSKGNFTFAPAGEVGDGGVYSGDRCIGHIYADERKAGYVYQALDTSHNKIDEFPTQSKAIDCVIATTLAKRRVA
jgi:hypothetical protein